MLTDYLDSVIPMIPELAKTRVRPPSRIRYILKTLHQSDMLLRPAFDPLVLITNAWHSLPESGVLLSTECEDLVKQAMTRNSPE
jgi:hypothetical protein